MSYTEQEYKAQERNLEQIAKSFLPYIYPSWPTRWGWTEASQAQKNECFRQARLAIGNVVVQEFGEPEAQPEKQPEEELSPDTPTEDPAPVIIPIENVEATATVHRGVCTLCGSAVFKGEHLRNDLPPCGEKRSNHWD